MQRKLFTLLIALLLISGNIWADTTFPRKMVVEEGTGTWCAWCVRGIVGMAYMKEKYPDTFIGIAVHASDEMTMNNSYLSSLGIYSYPSCLVNRSSAYTGWDDSYKYDPSIASFETIYEEIAAIPANAKVELTSAVYDNATDKIKVTTNTTFGYTASNVSCRLVYVVMENDVTGYKQYNAYAGSSTVMGGWEKLGSPVETPFDDVAREIYPSYSGIAGSIPASVTENTPLTHNYTLATPATVQDADQIEVVVMLLDTKTGEIINADKKHLTVEGDIPVTGVNLTQKGKTISIYYNKADADTTLTATTIPPYSTDRKITWSSSDPSVAKVDTSGVVTALTDGEVTISATSTNGNVSTCIIKSSSYVDVEGVELDAETIELKIGEERKITTTILPENANNKKTIAATSNSAVVGFKASGTITIVGKAVGEATITITSSEDKTKSASCVVTVIEGTGVEDIANDVVLNDIQTIGNQIFFTLSQPGKAFISLYDTAGKLAYSSVIDTVTQKSISIDAPIAKGVYILKINTEKGDYTKKIVID